MRDRSKAVCQFPRSRTGYAFTEEERRCDNARLNGRALCFGKESAPLGDASIWVRGEEDQISRG